MDQRIWLNSIVHEGHPSHDYSLVKWFHSTSLWNLFGFNSWFNQVFEKNESIHLMIQAVMKNLIQFDAWFKQKSFDVDFWFDSRLNQNHLQVGPGLTVAQLLLSLVSAELLLPEVARDGVLLLAVVGDALTGHGQQVEPLDQHHHRRRVQVLPWDLQHQLTCSVCGTQTASQSTAPPATHLLYYASQLLCNSLHVKSDWGCQKFAPFSFLLEDYCAGHLHLK